MKSIFFWNSFPPSYRAAYVGLLSIFALNILYFIFAYFYGDAAVIEWQTQSSLEGMPITLDSFNRGLYNFKVESENLLIKELFASSAIKVNLWSSIIYFANLLLAYCVGLSIITRLGRYWFLAAILVFIFIIVTLNFELLNLFGQANRYPTAVIIALYAFLAYYFHAFNKGVDFLWRFISFIALTCTVGIIIYWQGALQLPVLLFTNSGILVPMLLSILFFVIVSFDIIAFFLKLTASTATTVDPKRLFNFCIITSVYLVNLLLFVIRKMGFINWDMLYVNAFFLLIISAILGIWGYRKRDQINNEFLPFAPYGAMLYLCYGIVAFSTIAYAFLTDNQPLIATFDYAIVFTHFAFGFLFFTYVILNFNFLFKTNISIYKILYVPRMFPYFMVHSAGALLIISMFFKINMAPYNLTMAGYYNLLGDYYYKTKDLPLAKEYYESGVSYARYNKKSNYSLALLHEQNNQSNIAQDYYAMLLGNEPSANIYINLANWYYKNDMLLQAIFTLNDGIKAHPESGYIANNLGLLYSNTDIKDSVYYYLNKATIDNNTANVGTSNFIFQLIKDGGYALADSMVSIKNYGNDIKFKANAITSKSYMGKETAFTPPTIAKLDSVTPFEYAYVTNYYLNQIITKKNVSTALLDTINRHEGNEFYAVGLKQLTIFTNYYNGNKFEAFNNMEALYNSTENHTIATILATWYYEQECYEKAYEYYKNTISKNGQEAVLNCCLALCEDGKYADAKSNLIQLSESKSKSTSSIAATLISIFETASLQTVLSWSDDKKYQWVHFRIKDFALQDLEKISTSIATPFYHNLAMAELVLKAVEQKNLTEAQRLWTAIKNIPGENNFEKGVINYAEMQLAVAKKDFKKLQSRLPSLYLNSDKRNWTPYLKIQLEAYQNSKSDLSKQYLSAIADAPLNTKLIVEATNYFVANNKTEQAYNLITESLRQNNNSVPLLQSYIMVAQRLGYDSYAEDAQNRLSQLSSQ